MAQRTESTIRIDADPGVVIDIIGDVEAYPEWSDDLKTVVLLSSDEQDWPDEAAYTLDAGVITDEYVLAYEWDIAEDGTGVVSWQLARAKNMSAMDGSYTLVADGDGTLVTYRLTVEFKLPLPGVIRRRAEKRIVDTALEGLKRRAEG